MPCKKFLQRKLLLSASLLCLLPNFVFIQKSFAVDACADVAALCITTSSDSRTISDLTATSPKTVGYESRALDSSLTLTGGGTISAPTVGISFLGNNSILNNDGSVSAQIGVRFSSSSASASTGGILNNNASGTITGTYTGAIYLYGTGSSAEINNSGIIQGVGSNVYGVANEGTLIINNELTITGIPAVYNNNNLTLNNNGTISSSAAGGGYFGTIVSEGYSVPPSINLINNIGRTISATGSGSSAIVIGNGTANITNYGTISATGNSVTGSSDAHGISNYWSGTISDITNYGSITSTYGYGIYNYSAATITTLSNAQSNLTYYGELPQTYKIILGINASTYGTLNVTNPSNYDGASGITTFGIYSGTVKATRYAGVISGVSESYLIAQSGTYDGGTPSDTSDDYAWNLSLQSGSTEIWDLLFPSYREGPSLADTQNSLQTQSSYLMSAMNLQKTAINLGLNYDCTTFDSNGFCVGAGGRYTTLDSNSQFNNSSAIVVTSIKLAEYIRIGGYLDQNISSKLKDISLSNNKGPLGGLFVVLSENDKTHEGYELRLAANYQSKHADISREVIGNSEAGSGNASLESMGALGQISYSFKASDKILLTQYLGLRYSQIKRSAYIEGSNVSTPLSYSEVKDEAATALAGLKLNIALADDFNIQGHLGIEDDVHQKTGNLITSGIDGLTPVAISSDKNHFRGVAGIGAALNVSKYQVLRGYINYQQLPYQTKAATTAMLTYELGL